MTNPVHVLASVVVSPETEHDFVALATMHAQASLHEPGCLRFDVLRDSRDPLAFALVETFADQEALEDHRGTQHYATWKTEVRWLEAAQHGHREFHALPVARPWPSRKIMTLPELLPILEAARRCRQRIVFTNGCFDLLGAHHCYLLSEAKAQGDLLVVGLNNDASVRALKGLKRPINSEQDRAEVLAAMQAVDFVVTFSEETPQDLIEAIRPNVLCKGGDYAGRWIAGADFVASYGGRVHLVPIRDGYSSSSMLARKG